MSFNWFRKPRNLVWTGDVLIDARTDEVLARVSIGKAPVAWRWERWSGCWFIEEAAFYTREGAKKFVEEKFR